MKAREFEVDLEDRHVAEILRIAKADSPRDFLIFSYLAHGLRNGEVVGEKRLPGLHAEDYLWQEGTVKVIGKGYEAGRVRTHLQPVHPVILERTRDYLNGRVSGKLFQVSARTVRWMTKKYSRMAGVGGWEEVHPHRIRHWAANAIRPHARDEFEVMGFLRHSKKSLQRIFGTTVEYMNLPVPRRRELTLMALNKVLAPELPAPAVVPQR